MIAKTSSSLPSEEPCKELIYKVSTTDKLLFLMKAEERKDLGVNSTRWLTEGLIYLLPLASLVELNI